MDYALNHLPVKTQSRRWISLLLGDRAGNNRDLVQTRRGVETKLPPWTHCSTLICLMCVSFPLSCVAQSQYQYPVNITQTWCFMMCACTGGGGTICRTSFWRKQRWDFRSLFMYLFVNTILSPWKPGALYSFEYATHSIPNSQGSLYRSIPQASGDLWIPLSTKGGWMYSDDMISTQLYLIMCPHTHTHRRA